MKTLLFVLTLIMTISLNISAKSDSFLLPNEAYRIKTNLSNKAMKQHIERTSHYYFECKNVIDTISSIVDSHKRSMPVNWIANKLMDGSLSIEEKNCIKAFARPVEKKTLEGEDDICKYTVMSFETLGYSIETIASNLSLFFFFDDLPTSKVIAAYCLTY